MFKMFKKIDNNIYSISSGRPFAIEEVKDEVFSSKMMGEGIAFEINDSTIYSPITGEITVVFPDGHAIGLKRKDGVEVLIHIGLNVGELNGKGFYPKVKQGEHINSGEVLVELKLEELKGFDLTTLLIFTNTVGKPISFMQKDNAISKETIIAVI